MHDHHAIQIAISFNGLIEIIRPDCITNLKAVVIAADQQHECRTHQSTFVLLNVDPESKIGAGIKRAYLDLEGIAPLPEMICQKFLHEIEAFLSGPINSKGIHELVHRFLLSLSQTNETKITDERISKVLSVLKDRGNDKIKVNDLAGTIFLSPGRLIHLFTDQVGIPIRKYILWTRLLISLQNISQARNLTEAALEGGFSDAPHFNRTFKNMFGLNPSLLLKNSQIIQVYQL